VDAVRRVDLLVTEATYLERDADMARRFGHLTALQAATLAKEADVRKLVLTHISRRYRDRDVLEEAQTVFAETVVAHDFDRFQVVRQQT
jgi:ribonuclease Z